MSVTFSSTIYDVITAPTDIIYVGYGYMVMALLVNHLVH
jgi:hypothetical protein